MSFFLSKVVWALLTPSTLLMLALLGALWWRRRRPRLSNALLLVAASFLTAANLLPLTHWAAAPLEFRFPATEPPPRVDGIVVLGGAISTEDTRDTLRPALNEAGERVTAFVALARRYPQAKLVYSGGSGSVRDQGHPEADAARPMLESLGLVPARVIFERESRNTWENALYSKRLADPKPGETWLLVTSAWHMPRSVGCFRRAGWEVVPYPVNYLGSNVQWAWFDAAKQIDILGSFEKEWIGLAAYHLMGRTDAWFPAPRAAGDHR